jgi:MFS family permease
MITKDWHEMFSANTITMMIGNTIGTGVNTLWIMFMPFYYDVILTPIIDETPWRVFVIGVIYTLIALVQAAAVSVGGRASDRFGRKRMIVSGYCSYSLGPLIILFSFLVFPLNPVLSSIIAITGHSWTLGSGGLTRASSAMILVESSEKKNRGLSYMIASRVIPSIPPAVLIIVGTDLYANGMFWLALGIGALGIFVSAILYFFRLEETVPEKDLIADESRRSKHNWNETFILLLIVAFALDGLSSKGISFYVSLWVGNNNLNTYAYMIMLSTLVIAVFGIVAGRLVDRIGIRKSLTLGWCLLSITVFLFPYSTEAFEVLLLYSIWTGLDMIDLSIPPLVIADRYPERMRATIMGYFSSSVAVISIVGPTAISFFQLLGPTLPFAAKSAMNFIALLVFLFATKKTDKIDVIHNTDSG